MSLPENVSENAPENSGSPFPAGAAHLGAKLKALRLGLPAVDGKLVTQEQLAKCLLVGGKGVISLFESGKRIPTERTLDGYAQVCSTDVAELIVLRNAALDVSPPSTPRVQSNATRRRWRWPIAAAVLLALALGGMWWRSTAPRHAVDALVISSPGAAVAWQSNLTGSVNGLTDDSLWVDVRAVGDTRHHPADTPCERNGSVWTFTDLYLGNPADHGKEFVVSIVAVPKDSAAEKKLEKYGDRPTDGPNAYLGLEQLPAGTRVLASEVLRRR